MAFAAKESAVAYEGIGADTAPRVVAFGGDGELIGYAQIDIGSTSRQDQFRRLIGVAGLMRFGWHACSLAIILDGYTVLRQARTDEATDTRSLNVRFATGDKTVSECVSISCSDVDGNTSVATLPYTIGFGRTVAWHPHSENWLDDVGVVDSYPEALSEVFHLIRPVPYPFSVPVEVPMLAIADRIVDLGFVVVCDAFGDSASEWVNRRY